ncbi:putative LRR receptor-like serine/threonine-protein kinase [Forsythia ovata]|uniref:non-specific serine/threonine protein kinase n=2 Tax=Forsythia ovata TaxID=205694 RepID=A0ABD1WUW7_9LAMI
MVVCMMNLSQFCSLAFISVFLTNLSFPDYAAADTPGNETDKLALLAFKSQITEDPIGVLASWNDSLHLCNWTGVMCSNDQRRVTSLNLQGKRLAGTLSSYVGNFTFIYLLDLSGNSFHGEIPPELGNLRRIQNLNLSNNFLGGVIPSDLYNCSSLTSLALDHNYLIGQVPPGLGSLSELRKLYVGSNNFTGSVPASLGNLTSLQELDMSYNYLEGEIPINNLSGELPPPLYNLTSLEFIALSFNSFTGNLRNDIGLAFPNLQKIWLAYNFLTGPMPESFSNASYLQNIDFLHNNLTGKVPRSFGKLDLQYFSIGFNHLGSDEPDDLKFINSLTNCSNLRVLHFGDNQFEGVFPVLVTNLLTKLTRLYLEGNKIHGNIPNEISNLVNLNILYMNSNYLNGTIPDAFGMLPNLGTLILSSNQLTGKIPPSLGNMTGLINLFLFDNRLEGGIPSFLANCRQLAILFVCQNNLTGSIPQELMDIPSLWSLNVSYNSMTGSLPENVGNLTHLLETDLSYNKFSGVIPRSIGNCLSLNILFLQGNSFWGEIPYLADLQNLHYFDLSSNNLSGNIPHFLVNLPSFLYSNLSFNNLEGELPATGVFSNLSAIDVHGNPKLCGGIQELHLPPCSSQKPKKAHRKPLKLILVIVTVASFVALSLFLLLICWMKRLKKQTQAVSTILNFYPKISYEELLHATGGFSSENFIGSGSFGTVFKGILSSGGSVVAVKVLNLQQKGASRSFMAECQALRNIRHRNLVKVITACSTTDFQGNDFKALVYELMSNGSLEKWLHPEEEFKQNSLNILQRISIATDVASALSYLHHECQTPLIHCDLKPQNVLLDNNMTAHVGDFGLAQLLPGFNTREDINQFSSLGIKGTIGYAAPEYGMGRPVSIHGDVYSFGILLLEIFTGKRPTDKLFQENLNLHHFVKMALPERAMEILDNSALCEEVTGKAKTWHEGWRNLTIEQQECLICVLQIAVACSADLPKDRMKMCQVDREFSKTIDSFLHTGLGEEKKLSLSNRQFFSFVQFLNVGFHGLLVRKQS